MESQNTQRPSSGMQLHAWEKRKVYRFNKNIWNSKNAQSSSSRRLLHVWEKREVYRFNKNMWNPKNLRSSSSQRALHVWGKKQKFIDLTKTYGIPKMHRALRQEGHSMYGKK